MTLPAAALGEATAAAGLGEAAVAGLGTVLGAVLGEAAGEATGFGLAAIDGLLTGEAAAGLVGATVATGAAVGGAGAAPWQPTSNKQAQPMQLAT